MYKKPKVWSSKISQVSSKSRLVSAKSSFHCNFRHVILKGISSQLVSARLRPEVNAGLPTVMSAASTFIAVGTSHGFVFVFDGQQTLKYSLRAPDSQTDTPTAPDK